VKQWFLNPVKFKAEMEAEQQKHVGKCLYHLTKSHPTCDCYIKKECDKIVADRKSNGSQTSSTSTSRANGQLRNIKEELEEETLEDDVPDTMSESNDTNEEDLAYFTRIKNHYLRLVKSSSNSRHIMEYPIIVDSGANYHMFKEKEFFTSLTPTQGSVILGDGKTTLAIEGIGTIKCVVGNNTLIIDNVRYVPQLAESIYSLFLHIKQQSHGVQSSFDAGLSLKFPTFTTKTIIGKDDIYLDALPHPNNITVRDFLLSSSSTPKDAVTTCCHNTVSVSTSDGCRNDNLLQSLHQYYSEVKTKRQLNLNVPAGFRSSSKLQQDYNIFAPPCKAGYAEVLSDPNVLSSTPTKNTTATITTLSSTESTQPSPSTTTSTIAIVPILRCVDKPSSSLPSRITVTEDFVRSSVGFRRIDTIKLRLSSLYQDTVKFDSTPPDAVLDHGDLCNLRKSCRNTSSVARPNAFGDVIHMDIVFGPDIALGNVHYGLLFTDRFSRMTYIYPLQNLTSAIKIQLEAIFAHLGFLPKRIITDFDTKLIGGKAREYLNSLLIHTNAAPTFRQDKNGLAERHWQTLIAMARGWLASAELLGSFWYYAVKRAAEICNYFPVKLD